ncbi:MAG: YceI family protein [Paracoccaceae bacterium]
MRAFIVLLLTTGIAHAAPTAYAIQPDASAVGFETDFGPDKITGRMPVTRADLSLDFQHVAASTVAVTLDVAGAQASFPFAAQAMKGPKVLDSGDFPTITFQSTAVKAEGDGAAVQGNITIRGITKPAVLHAVIYRQTGTVAGDLSHLTIRLTGAVNRSEFGAVGWADAVGDQVRLDIVARIQRVQ